MLLQPPISQMPDQFARYGAIIAPKYTFPTADPSVKTEDSTTDDGTKVRVYTSGGYTGGKPVCLYYHGGGWSMGDINGDDQFSRAISKFGNIVVVSVEYGLTPGNKHPRLIQDSYKALTWALRYSNRLNNAEGKFLTAGLSAGGHFAFATALGAVDKGLGLGLVGVVALIPGTVHPDAVPEELCAKTQPWKSIASIPSTPELRCMLFGASNPALFPTHHIDNIADAFGAPPMDHYTSPLLHPRLKDLKRVHMAVAGHDTLRDDGVLMKLKLDEVG
jgi:versiconal hemiacetal acetate esterase